ncbi:PQQ-dependent dehydrogenase, methanol/ethanol family [Bryobacter aggregatus]|uniref:PQQ-dependent dehydrogenase, methanol/ethanol family n=1 Tax=Bryobacter aggregatus TaxID=360054 RepID=UPI0009B5D082|nr:PQQ-dependent dehydrogenase, methanol/ethanol family [Bryobacter aggregatus]
MKRFALLLLPLACLAQTPSGKRLFEARCAMCHGADAAGGERGPSLIAHPVSREIIRNGKPASGMPAFAFSDDEMNAVVGYIESRAPRQQKAVEKTVTVGGRSIEGLVQNESNFDQQLLGRDGRLYLIDRAASRIESPEPLSFASIAQPQEGEWPTYNGNLNGNRHSSLREIHRGNVSKLAPRWIFTLPNAKRLEGTPLVANGVMYMSAANEVFALDARSGRQIWHFQMPLTKGVIGDAASAINRGVALLGDRVFLVTDHAHLLALDRLSGKLIWDTKMADFKEHYGTTSAPLIVKDLVITGSSGGDEGARGFIAAYRASTGEEVWRHWTMPAPGDPEAATWKGRAIEHGCGAPWLTGSYDPQLSLLYWTTGNPCPDYNGDERIGDNLYTSSVLALEPETGKRRWYFQFTPHDLHDWDAAQPVLLVDAPFQGKPRKLLLQANRNGFFYVLDRVSGEFLLGEKYVKKMDWASGLTQTGRPILVPGKEPSEAGTQACPAVEGASNWMSSSYSAATGLFYVMTLERCSIYLKSAAWWEPGKSFYGGGTNRVPGENGEKILRAIHVATGKIAWEYPQIGSANSWGGVLSTDGGLVFFGEDSGAFAAVDAKTGAPLWHFQTSQLWKASPMSYRAGGRQFIAIAAGGAILAFGLPE